jgi:c-di-GMP-binding flagellar brake protein YcgR
MKKIEERRKFIRLEVPVELKYIVEGDPTRKEVTTKDLSCEGLRFITEQGINEGTSLELNLIIPNASNPVHINGKVVWARKITTEDSSPFEVGVEFVKIEEDNKNTFLRYLCDLIYSQTKMMEDSRNTT